MYGFQETEYGVVFYGFAREIESLYLHFIVILST